MTDRENSAMRDTTDNRDGERLIFTDTEKQIEEDVRLGHDERRPEATLNQRIVAAIREALSSKERELREAQAAIGKLRDVMDDSQEAYALASKRMTAERDAARAEVERLRAELQPYRDAEKRHRDILGDPRKIVHVPPADWGPPQGTIAPRPTPATSGEPDENGFVPVTPEALAAERKHVDATMDAVFGPLPASPPAPADLVERALPERLWQDLLDKDDRTSPEEYPDMALITQAEFFAALASVRDEATRRAAETAFAKGWLSEERAKLLLDIALSDQPQPDTGEGR